MKHSTFRMGIFCSLQMILTFWWAEFYIECLIIKHRLFSWCWNWNSNPLATWCKGVMATWGWLIGKDPVAGKDWRQEENGMTQDEMVGWYHWAWVWANFQRERTGKTGVMHSIGCSESVTTERLNTTTNYSTTYKILSACDLGWH